MHIGPKRIFIKLIKRNYLGERKRLEGMSPGKVLGCPLVFIFKANIFVHFSYSSFTHTLGQQSTTERHLWPQGFKVLRGQNSHAYVSISLVFHFISLRQWGSLTNLLHNHK